MQAALERAVADMGAPGTAVVLERPRDASHGDVATNVAMQLARVLKRAPRQIAEEIVERLDVSPSMVSGIEVAGPGFINFRLAEAAVTEVLREILAAGVAYGRSDEGQGSRVNVEFVSANPTGPLHVGHGRGAALGDAIAALLEATGHDVVREFYVNDAGVQIDRLAESVWARVQQTVGREAPIPEGGYHGEYVVEMAAALLEERGEAFADLDVSEALPVCRAVAVRSQRAEQREDLEHFRVRFDVYSSETTLYEDDSIGATLGALGKRDVVYERDGALWLRTSSFGDEKDRVLRKRDGTYTYFLPDIAYHLTKARRGFDRAIDVWGADHHGYVARMRAALRAMGLAKEFFDVVLVQLVRVMREGEEVRFSKRSGDFVTLRDLCEQTGVDAARYFFLLRRGDSQFVFDIDLATRQSEENPVYYVQYAHTRIAGILRNAEVDPSEVTGADADLGVLDAPEELGLAKALAEYPKVVARSAEMLEPHRVIAYLDEVARLVNVWYHRHRVVGEPATIRDARLVLVRAAQVVLANGLGLLGISAPERM